jgi:hypothetical protein
MLSIEKCKKVLQEKGKKYTDEEVKAIRELLYKLGRIDYQCYKEQKHSHEKSHHLHKG